MTANVNVMVDATLAGRLKQVGITVLDPERFTIECDCCGAIGRPNIQCGGGLHPRFWKCRNGCNAHRRLARVRTE